MLGYDEKKKGKGMDLYGENTGKEMSVLSKASKAK